MFECARANAHERAWSVTISKEKIGGLLAGWRSFAIDILYLHYIHKNLKVFNNKGKLKDWTFMQNGPSNKKTPEPLTNIEAEDRLRSLYGKLEIFM